MNLEMDRIADQALAIAKKLKIDEAEVYLTSNRIKTVRIAGNAIFESVEIQDMAVGLRVILGKGLGFGVTSDLTKLGIERATSDAIKSCKHVSYPFRPSFPKPAKPSHVQGLYDKELTELESVQVVELASRMLEASSAFSGKICDNAGVVTLVENTVLIANTNGISVVDKGTFFETSFTATARSNGLTSEGADGTGGRNLHEIEPEQIGRNAAVMAVDGLKAEKVENGCHPLVVWYEPAAILVFGRQYSQHPFGLGYGASSFFARTDLPLLVGRQGQKIASEKISFYDDQTMARGYGSCTVDDEGVPARKIPIIEKGVFKTFLYDMVNAKLEGVETTGGACRRPIKTRFIIGTSMLPGRYAIPPNPVPLNPVLEAGRENADEIIEETKDGLLAKRFFYTLYQNPLTGDFSSILRMGLYRVKNGEVVGAVKRSRLVGNLLEMLLDVDMVSKERQCAGFWGDYAIVPILRTKGNIVSL